MHHIQTVGVDSRVDGGIDGFDRKSLHLVRCATDDRLEIAQRGWRPRGAWVPVELNENRRPHADLDITVGLDSDRIARGVIGGCLDDLLRGARNHFCNVGP